MKSGRIIYPSSAKSLKETGGGAFLHSPAPKVKAGAWEEWLLNLGLAEVDLACQG